jgi:hypothetical protein
MGNKPPGKGNHFSSASNALCGCIVRLWEQMAGCLRSAVPLALHSKLIETIGGYPDFLRSYQFSESWVWNEEIVWKKLWSGGQVLYERDYRETTRTF